MLIYIYLRHPCARIENNQIGGLCCTVRAMRTEYNTVLCVYTDWSCGLCHMSMFTIRLLHDS